MVSVKYCSIPSSVVGMICVYIIIIKSGRNFVSLHIMKNPITGNITISTSATQRKKMGIKMTEDAVYEVPFSMIEMKECEAYAPLHNRP